MFVIKYKVVEALKAGVGATKGGVYSVELISRSGAKAFLAQLLLWSAVHSALL